MKSLSCVQLFATPWTITHQAPPSMGFSRQEYWSGLPFPSPEDLSDPGIEPRSPALEADALTSEPPWKIQASKVILKILQARLQQYVNHEIPDVQTGCRKGRRSRDQIANIRWIIEKAREFQKNIYFCFIDYTKAFDCVDPNKLWEILQEMWMPDHLTCLLRNLYAGQEATVRTDKEQGTGSKSGKEYIKAVYCHPAYLIYMQSTSHEMLGWMKDKLESRFLEEISITSDIQMTPPL